MSASTHTGPEIPKTQGIKYAGSKLKILPHILALISETKAESIFDGFSGTTRVSQALGKQHYTVDSNDLSDWSYSFATAFLKNHKDPPSYQKLIDHLNGLNPVDGWFSDNYGGSPDSLPQDSLKKPWQIHNTRKLDAIREEIDRLELDNITHAVALVSLMLALDEVDSTLGHHSSYLREWAPRSYKHLKLKIPNLWKNEQDHHVTQTDVFDAISSTQAQLAYFDPPYGSNNEKMPASRVRYAGYYHLWTTVCRNDQPKLFGKAGRRMDSSDTQCTSPFEDFRKLPDGTFIAVEAIDRLLEMTPCEWVLLSYSSGGRATAQQLNDSIRRHGKLIKSVEIEYRKHVMANMQSTQNWLRDDEEKNREFLLLVQKT